VEEEVKVEEWRAHAQLDGMMCKCPFPSIILIYQIRKTIYIFLIFYMQGFKKNI
jgi:hypothetical protein